MLAVMPVKSGLRSYGGLQSYPKRQFLSPDVKIDSLPIVKTMNQKVKGIKENHEP